MALMGVTANVAKAAGERAQVSVENMAQVREDSQRVARRAPHRRRLPRKRRRSSEDVDLLRARALLDDDLAELSDAEREWVWRSLLKGIRVEEACVLALLDLDRLDEAMEGVRHRYELRTLEYKARRAQQLARGHAEGRG